MTRPPSHAKQTGPKPSRPPRGRRPPSSSHARTHDAASQERVIRPARFLIPILLLLLAGALVARRFLPSPDDHGPRSTVHGPSTKHQAGGRPIDPSTNLDPREAELQAAVRSRPNDAAAHQELGAYQVARGRPFEGLWELMAARELGRDDAALAVQIAGALRDGGLPGAAYFHAREARRRWPSDTGLDLALARAILGRAETEGAVAVIDQNPALAAAPEGLLMLATAHLADGQEVKARRSLKACRAAAKDRPDLLLALGRLELAAPAASGGNEAAGLRQARADLDAAAAARPNDEVARYWAGVAYASSSTPEEQAKAVEHLKAAIQAAPRKARAGFALGRLLYEKQGRREKALEIYRQALKLDPQSVEVEAGLARVTAALKLPEALYHEARVRELTERSEEAVAFYRRWGQRQPERWDSVLRAAEGWMDLQQNKEAARELERGLKRFPDHIELFNHLAQVYLLLNDVPAVQRVCDRWVPLDTTSGRPERIRGKLALLAHDLEGAIRLLGEAIRKNPEIGTFHADLADALSREPTPERLALARTALQRAIDLEPGNPSHYQQLGSVLLQTGDLELARQVLLRGLSLEPTHVEPYVSLVQLAQRLKQPATAALFAGLEREVRAQQRDEGMRVERLWREPGNTAARFEAAEALLRRGALAPARDHLEVAISRRLNWPEAQALLRRVRLLTQVH